MKNSIFTFFCLVALISFVSCGGEKSPSENSEKVKTTESKVGDQKVGELTMDNGKKWPINKEMIPHIRHMELLSQSFGGKTPEDFNELGVLLQKDCQSLISSCTMSGPAHNQLHNWLTPYMQTVKDLAECSDKRKGKALYLKIGQDLKTFDTHFD